MTNPESLLSQNLLYDKAHLLAINDFVNANIQAHPREEKLRQVNSPIDTLRSRRADITSKLLLKKALFSLLKCSDDYLVRLDGLANWPSYFSLTHTDTSATFYVTPSEILLDKPTGDAVFLLPEQSSWYSRTQAYTKHQLIDELIRQFPNTDFSFLNIS